jgi:excisionase family DNA binding protein
MEKICIVKRRQEYTQSKSNQPVQDICNSSPVTQDLNNNMPDTVPQSFNDERILKGFQRNSRHEICVPMTIEQSDMLRTSEYIKNILNGAAINPVLRINNGPDGCMILKLNLDESPLVRMLRSDQVCAMLQIGRSLLMRLIRENKIRSYKVGRLRRFWLDDILEYLISNQEFYQLNN